MTQSNDRATGVVDPRQLMATAAQAVERGQAFLQSVQVIHTELVKFWIGRIDQDWMLAGELAKCRSLDEMLPVQQRFVEEMVHAYATLAPRLLAPLGVGGQVPDEAKAVGRGRATHDRAA